MRKADFCFSKRKTSCFSPGGTTTWWKTTRGGILYKILDDSEDNSCVENNM